MPWRAAVRLAVMIPQNRLEQFSRFSLLIWAFGFSPQMASRKEFCGV